MKQGETDINNGEVPHVSSGLPLRKSECCRRSAACLVSCVLCQNVCVIGLLPVRFWRTVQYVEDANKFCMHQPFVREPLVPRLHTCGIRPTLCGVALSLSAVVILLYNICCAKLV